MLCFVPATWQLGRAVLVGSAAAYALVGFVCVSFVVARFLLCVLRLETFWLAGEAWFRGTVWGATLVQRSCGYASFVFIWSLEFCCFVQRQATLSDTCDELFCSF